MVDGLEAPIMARMRGEIAPESGAEIGISVNPDDVLLFAKVPD